MWKFGSHGAQPMSFVIAVDSESQKKMSFDTENYPFDTMQHSAISKLESTKKKKQIKYDALIPLDFV